MPPRDPSAPWPVPGPGRGVGAHSPGSGGAATQGHTAQTLALPAIAHRLFPGAAPSGNGVGIGLGTASGRNWRTRALAGPTLLWPCPLSAGSQRCRATVRPPKVSGQPAGLAQAFRTCNVPNPRASGLRAQRTSYPLPRSVLVLTAGSILVPCSVLVSPPVHPQCP